MVLAGSVAGQESVEVQQAMWGCGGDAHRVLAGAGSETKGQDEDI